MKCFRCNHHGCSLLLFQYVVFMIFVAALSDFPTYNHPEYPNQRCYKCPPGYILDKHCTVGSLGTDAYTPRWGRCVACEPGEYMDNWNIDRRCYDRQTCSSTQKDYSKTSSPLLSDAVCACNSSSIENKDGECVKGIPKADHDTAINKVFQDCDRMVSILTNTGKNTGTTSTPTTPVTYTVECQGPVMSIDECGLSQGEIAELSILGILLLLSLLANLCQFIRCRKYHQQNKDKDDKSRKNVPQDSVVSHEDETKKPKNIAKPPNVAQRKERGPNGCHISLATSHGNPSFEHIADAKPEDRQNTANTILESEFEPLLLHGDRGDAQAQEKKKSLDKACHILEQSIRTSEDLDKFTRDILGFTSDVCEDIKRKDEDIRSKVRKAFSEWERKNSKAATPRILVRGLRKHKWNKEADRIAAEYNVGKEEVEEDEEDSRLDDAIKICERMVIGRNLRPFVRDCLGRNDNEISNNGKFCADRSSTIREAFKGWVRENSSEATVQKLVKRLIDCEFTSVADSICMELNLQEPSKQDNEHRASAERGAEEEQQNKIASSKEDTARSLNLNSSSEIVPVRKNVADMEYDKSFTEGPQEDDKAVPVYNQQEQPPPEPVREMPQPTDDATPFDGTTNRSRASSETSAPDNKSAGPQNTSRTEPKGFFGTEPQKATSDYVDDDGTVKVDDENYGREIEEVGIVDEPNAGADGKAIEESDDDEEQSQA